jgi:predicted DNA-binding transcriptional regulator AlpA
MNSLPSSQDDRLIDFKETAHLLGDISERSVRRLIARGELPPPVKVLSAPRLYRSEVLAYLQTLKGKRPRSRL